MKRNSIKIYECIDKGEIEELLSESEFIYTTTFWLDYLSTELEGKPIILKIIYQNNVAIFVGFIFKKYCLKICGSPFEGWSTPYMGFVGINKFANEERYQIIKSTTKFLLKQKRCSYVQICDWNIDIEFAKKYRFKYDIHSTYLIDISKSDDELFSSFKTDARTNCRNFLKRGAYLKVVNPSIDFSLDHYNQLVDVFDKQNLKPFYSKDKIDKIILHFTKYPEYIFCENVYEPKTNSSIATGIFFGYKKRCYFFGAASYRKFQSLRPNDYVIWNAIKYWKGNGCTSFDMLGIRKYKEKFSPDIVKKPIMYFSRTPLLHFFKKIAKKIILQTRKKR